MRITISRQAYVWLRKADRFHTIRCRVTKSLLYEVGEGLGGLAVLLVAELLLCSEMSGGAFLAVVGFLGRWGLVLGWYCFAEGRGGFLQ